MNDRVFDEKNDGLYSDDEINELADWFQDLTIKQLFFLKQSYDAMQVMQAQGIMKGNTYVQ